MRKHLDNGRRVAPEDPDMVGAPLEERMRYYFHRLDDGSLHDAAEMALEVGLVPYSEAHELMLQAVANKFRKALKKIDSVTGLPLAGPTTRRDEAGRPIWATSPHWTLADYELNISEYAGKGRRMHEIAVLMAKDCYRRYGQAPSIEGLAPWSPPTDGRLAPEAVVAGRA